MATTCPGDLAGLRDRALLLLAAGTGLGRTALVSLDAQRVALVAGGWPPIRRHRARSAAQPRFVAVVRRDIRALIASFR
jgi:site-specific recombinase XerC